MYFHCRHRFLANKLSLRELHNHVVEVRLWSSSKKVATSTRYDRPKVFKLPTQSLPLELLKQPTQYVLVSHNPANAMPKLEKYSKGDDLVTTGSDDSSGGKVMVYLCVCVCVCRGLHVYMSGLSYVCLVFRYLAVCLPACLPISSYFSFLFLISFFIGC